jgi:hypothetical protein
MVRYFILLTAALALAACANQPDTTITSSKSQYGVSPIFSQYYADHGGEGVMGAPISSEVSENGLTVQYFQNAKLEYHPQLPGDNQIILASLGQDYYGLSRCVPAASADNTLYFNNCHAVDPAFREYFEKRGGVAFFGYPISERYIFEGVEMAQNFERATIVWDTRKPVEYRFGLLPLGVVVCPKAACSADNRSADFGGVVVVPPASTPTSEAAVDPLIRFFQEHGGQRVFGNPLAEPAVGKDGAREQAFDNAILYVNPSAPEGVSLRPLGLKLLGNPTAPALPLSGPNTGYFVKYGHNIVYNVFDFYKANGGENVFGQPISEMQTAAGYFVQYFENMVFTVHYNLPADQIVQLMPLGRDGSLGQTAAHRNQPPQVLVVWTQPLRNVFSPATETQTITTQVLDENGLAVSGAQTHFTIHTPAGDMDFTGTTDDNGYASYTFGLSSYTPGDFMLYDVTVTYGSLSNTASASFVTWGNQTQTP